MLSPEDSKKADWQSLQQWQQAQRAVQLASLEEFFAQLRSLPPDPMFNHMGDELYLRRLHISPA